MACARPRMSTTKGLLKSELETVIDQANLGREDTEIAKLYLIDQIPQIDIAIECGYDRSTISKRIKEIVTRVERAARKMGLT